MPLDGKDMGSSSVLKTKVLPSSVLSCTDSLTEILAALSTELCLLNGPLGIVAGVVVVLSVSADVWPLVVPAEDWPPVLPPEVDEPPEDR